MALSLVCLMAVLILFTIGLTVAMEINARRYVWLERAIPIEETSLDYEWLEIQAS